MSLTVPGTGSSVSLITMAQSQALLHLCRNSTRLPSGRPQVWGKGAPGERVQPRMRGRLPAANRRRRLWPLGLHWWMRFSGGHGASREARGTVPEGAGVGGGRGEMRGRGLFCPSGPSREPGGGPWWMESYRKIMVPVASKTCCCSLRNNLQPVQPVSRQYSHFQSRTYRFL